MNFLFSFTGIPDHLKINFILVQMSVCDWFLLVDYAHLSHQRDCQARKGAS